MGSRSDPLIAQIEKDALDGQASLSSALRKCVSLGGKSGSTELRDWATRELKGYSNIDDLPDYRKIAASLRLDGVSGNYKITGEELPPMALPEFAREHISNEVPLTQGVGELEALTKHADIRLAPPGASNLAMYMNTQGNTHEFSHVNAIYWAVSHAALEGVLDQIRTSLTQLVAELRANMSATETVPSAVEAAQAVYYITTGKRSSVNVNTAQATGSDSTATAAVAETDEEPSWWTTGRRIGAFIVGIAAVAAAVFAGIEVL